MYFFMPITCVRGSAMLFCGRFCIPMNIGQFRTVKGIFYADKKNQRVYLAFFLGVIRLFSWTVDKYERVTVNFFSVNHGIAAVPPCDLVIGICWRAAE